MSSNKPLRKNLNNVPDLSVHTAVAHWQLQEEDREWKTLQSKCNHFASRFLLQNLQIWHTGPLSLIMTLKAKQQLRSSVYSHSCATLSNQLKRTKVDAQNAVFRLPGGNPAASWILVWQWNISISGYAEKASATCYVAYTVWAEYKLGGLINELCRRSVASGGLSIKLKPPLEPDCLCLPVFGACSCRRWRICLFDCLTVASALWQNVLFADALSVHVFVSIAD